jgi:hypothetical protein
MKNETDAADTLDILFRPKAAVKKIHSSHEFELCYLRHQYLRRTTYNPTKAEMLPYATIGARMARNTFFTYKGLFYLVGLDIEDLESIATVQIVSFLGLFEITKDPVKYENFVCKHQKKYSKDPGPYDIVQKNKAIFTLFLKQRMQDVVRVCQQKARNIKGKAVEEFYAYSGIKRLPPWVLPNLMGQNEKYGYRKIDVATFKSARKKAKLVNERVFKFEDKWFVAIDLDHRPLEIEDLTGADFDPRDNYHNMTPERIMQERESTLRFETLKSNFSILGKAEKKVVFETFIRENKENKKLAAEVATAQKMLGQMGR